MDQYINFDYDEFHGHIAGYLNPGNLWAYVTCEFNMHYDGILTQYHIEYSTWLSVKRWTINSEYEGPSPTPYSDIGASSGGGCECIASINDWYIYDDQSMAYAELYAWSKCTGAYGEVIDKRRAVKVDDGAISLSTTAHDFFSWNPGGSGDEGWQVGALGYSGAYNYGNFTKFFVENYVDTIKVCVKLDGHYEYGFAMADFSGFLNPGH